MQSLLAQIAASQENFSVFIDENMRRSTYQPLWVQECGLPDYSASKNFTTYTGGYAAAMVASIIEKNAEKPLRNMPTVGQITGTLGRMGDKFQMDNDRLDHLMFLEGRYRNNAGQYTQPQRLEQYRRIVDYLFNPFEMAAIAPHKRLDMLYFEGLSNGTFTVNIDNNPNGIQWTLDLQIRTYILRKPIWNTANAATSDPFDEIKFVVDDLEGKGKIVQRMRMTNSTFTKLLTSNKFLNVFKLNLGSLEVNPTSVVTLDMINKYLDGVGLPPIVIERKLVNLPDNTTINMFKDDRIVFQCADRVGQIIVADSLEKVDPHPNKVYQTYNDNLISLYRTPEGRFIEYEMWGIPVFNASQDFAILKIDQTSAQ